MKILITGATGFIGRQVVLHLRDRGHTIAVLTRDAKKALVRLPIACPVFSWPNADQPPPREAFDGVDAVVHLAGENIINRWTVSRKKKIINSTVTGETNR
jgi:NAD dependent epimerase/dehydratase family enzyme